MSSYFATSLRQLIGLETRKPSRDDLLPEVRAIYDAKGAYKAEPHPPQPHVWRNRRWLTLVLINLLFVISYYFDVQLVEGALTASRVVGFHFADLNSALQVMLAFKHVVLNLIIGTTTVLILWLLAGGRSFCSWVCPYHLIAEWAEWLHLKLAARGLAKDLKFPRAIRAAFYVIFALLALLTGYTVFEAISPTGIVSRALIYGPGLALAWVGTLLLFEVFVSRRAWCRYICPIGITYGAVGLFTPLRVEYNITACHHEGDCRKVCLVPHVLDVTVKNRAVTITTDLGADCTRCGLCIDVCPTGSLNYRFRGLEKLT